MRRSSHTLPAFLRPLAGQIHGIILLGLALALVVLNLFFPTLVQQVRVTMTDLFAPLMHAAATPASALQGVSAALANAGDIRAENTKLRAEVENLRSLHTLAQQYAEENRNLKDLLKYKDESTLSYLTTRVIGQTGGNFTDSVIVTAGKRDGVIKGMVAMNEDGVVGRVVEAGEWSSRVLLLNDFNFRLPVMLEGTQQRAILSGEGEDLPRLLFLPNDSEVKAGARIVTSGHGGLFPPYLPVGSVKDVGRHEVTVQPHARLDRLHIIRLVQYNLAGGADNPLNQELATGTSQKPVAVTPAPNLPPPAPRKGP